MYGVQCTAYGVRSTVRCTLYAETAQCTVMYSKVYTVGVWCTVKCTVRCTVYGELYGEMYGGTVYGKVYGGCTVYSVKLARNAIKN